MRMTQKGYTFHTQALPMSDHIIELRMKTSVTTSRAASSTVAHVHLQLAKLLSACVAILRD
jgi:hypothetical protein